MNWLRKQLSNLSWFKSSKDPVDEVLETSLDKEKRLAARPKPIRDAYVSTWQRHQDEACIAPCWYCERVKFSKAQDSRLKSIWKDRPELKPVGFHNNKSKPIGDGPLPLKFKRF